VLEIQIDDLHKSFGSARVLRGVSLVVRQGEMVAIVGGSGCGKTVLLKHITGHHVPDAGRVLVADHESPDQPPPLRDLATLTEAELDRLRIHWAMVFQRNALLSGTVFHNLALWPREIKWWSDEAIMPRARQALLDVGLDPDHVMTLERESLSGGMAKRVAIARALVMDPVLILYDEPTAGLDPEMCVQIHDLMRTTHEATPGLAAGGGGPLRTSVIVTHDTQLLERLMPRVVMLFEGKVLFDGSFDEFAASSDPHIKPYLAQMAFLHMR
jgi:phospholipid/cholesterol/gamma-HCH transport system ATP-binding protein